MLTPLLRIASILMLCATTAALGNVTITDMTGTLLKAPTGGYISSVSINASYTVCERQDETIPAGGGTATVTQTCSADNGATHVPATSMYTYICNYDEYLKYPLFCALALLLGDPVILDLPSSANGTAGTFDNGQGFSGPLVVTSGLTTIPIDMNTSLTAAPGRQLAIVELPPGAPAGNYHFAFQSTTGTGAVRALLAAKVQIAGKTYYPPTMPCVTDFASVPYFEFSGQGSISLLTPNYLAQIQGCNRKIFNFPAAGAPSAVDVIEFYNAGLDHYFITYGAQEISDLDTGVHKGWARTGQSFKAYTTPQAGTSPVCRFYIPPGKGDSHFFGRGTVECNATGAAHPDFDLEDPAFMQMFLPVAGVCPANTTEVYRVFSNRADANHRYMTDPAIRDQMAAKGWTIEGDGPHFVVMCAPQ